MDNQSSNFTQRERREIRRHEQRAQSETARKKQWLKRISIWGGSVVIVGGLTYLFVGSAQKTEENRPGEPFPIQGRDHIAVGAQHEPYRSNPPTSGSHYAQPADWGVYEQELPDEQLIHNLEHGGIWISYKDIDQDTKD